MKMFSSTPSSVAATRGSGDQEFPSPKIREAEYLSMVERFDALWGSVTSERDQKEMQRLIITIERFESELGVCRG